jgi:hypothetical protein
MTVKVLGQAAPAATTNVNVYTVPSSTQAVLSTVVVANRDSAAGTFRLAVRPAGAAIVDQHYVAFDVPIAGNDSTTLTLGITMDETDILTFQASSADMSVNVFGTELS